MGDRLCRVGTISSLILDCEGLLGFVGICFLGTGDCSGHTMILGAKFEFLSILLVFVILLYVGM